MKTALASLAAFLAAATGAHFATLYLLPGHIMSTARGAMIERGLPLHTFVHSPRVTPETQTIVRPAPDLAYAICLIDVSAGPVRVEAPRWNGYGSLSVFDARTDNVVVASLDNQANPDAGPVRLLLRRKGRDHDYRMDVPPEGEPVDLGSDEALVLIRRLAPTPEAFAAAEALMAQTLCSPL